MYEKGRTSYPTMRVGSSMIWVRRNASYRKQRLKSHGTCCGRVAPLALSLRFVTNAFSEY
jgi:hypothetical protein